MNSISSSISMTLTGEPIDSVSLQVELKSSAKGACGALSTFEGIVRASNEGHVVLGLDYEAYAELSITEGEAILEEARDKFAIEIAHCAHRTGSLGIGETAVWIGVGAAHRDEAFRACRYIIDEIKSRLPIWKKEHYKDGDSGWVSCSRHMKR